MSGKYCFILLALLLVTACVPTSNDDYVAIPKAELESLQTRQQLEESRQIFEDYRRQAGQTLDALQQSMAMQRDLVEAQLRSQAELNRSVRQRDNDEAELELRPVPINADNGLNDKMVVGEIEDIYFPELKIVMTSRIDTGATTSSIDARNIQEFERNGERWVRFTLIEPDSGEEIELERQRVRLVRIIQSNEDEGERRPVVVLRITIGSLTQMSEFTLTDRSHLELSVIIGRNVLRDVMVVDISRRHVMTDLTQNAVQRTVPNNGSQEEVDEPEEREFAVEGENGQGDE